MKKFLTVLTSLFIFGALALPAFAAKDDIQLDHSEKGIYVVKVNTKKAGTKIKPYVSDKLITSSEVFQNNKNYVLVANGGFFDILTGAAVSYVVIDGKTVETPFSNIGLIQNAAKCNRLEGILNRAEFRILENARGALTFDMDYHFAPIEEGKTIKHSLQGGPMLLPHMNLEKESFVIKEGNKVKFQAADVLKRRERTVLAIKDNLLYIIIFTNQNRVTIEEARDFCKKLGADKAMALDGGASTSLNYKDIEIFSSFTSQRRVKSFLVVER